MESFIDACQHLRLAEAIRSVMWAYPLIEILHIAGLVLVFGSILVQNLRMLGAFLKTEPVPEVARDLTRFTFVGLGVQVLTGPLLFITSAMRFYESTPFRVKLSLLTLALLFHFTIHWRVARGRGPLPGKLTAGISMVSWIAVVVAGLSIELLD